MGRLFLTAEGNGGFIFNHGGHRGHRVFLASYFLLLLSWFVSSQTIFCFNILPGIFGGLQILIIFKFEVCLRHEHLKQLDDPVKEQ